MKEEVRRIMKLVQEGKLSPDDAAELIDAFAAGETGEGPESEEPKAEASGPGAPPPPPPSTGDMPPEPPSNGSAKDPFKSFVDAMEKLGKEIRDVNWTDVAKQVREGAAKGVEGIKTGVEKLRDGRWGWGGQETREITLPLSIPEGKTLRIENASGDIKIVRGGGLGSVHASAKFRGQDDFEARDKADRYTLIIEESDQMVLIRQPDVSGMSVDLNLQLSSEAAISVHSDSGDIHVSDTASSCKVVARSGDIHLRGLKGPIDVNHNDGDLTIEDCQGPSISVESKSGDLVFRRVKGNMNVRTANGDISVIDGSCKTVSLESVSGDISLSLSDDVTGTVNIRTVNGDATVQVPASSDARVTLSTLRGDVSCGIELADEARADQRVTGRLGSGAGVIDVSAVNGDVSLGTREPSTV